MCGSKGAMLGGASVGVNAKHRQLSLPRGDAATLPGE
jgi:hypothetical protein